MSSYDKDVAQLKKLLLMTDSDQEGESKAFIKKAKEKMFGILGKMESENQREVLLAIFSRFNTPHVAYGHQNRQRRVKNSSFKIYIGDSAMHFDPKGMFLAVETGFGKIQSKKDYDTITSVVAEEPVL